MEKRIICDAHTHIFPTKIAEKAAASIGHFYNLHMELGRGDTMTLLESGSKIGVQYYLVCSVATKPEQVHAINDFIAGEMREHPEFVGLGSLHPEMEDPFAEIERIRSLGLCGVKLHPDFQRFDIDDERMMPVYKAIAEAGLPVLFHTGDARYEFSRPCRLRRVIERVPSLRATAAHFGGYQRWEEAAEQLADLPGVTFDVSSSMPFLGRERSRMLIEHFGADRFFFGTDFPMWMHEEVLADFLALGLTEQEEQKILGLNFMQYYHLSPRIL